MKTKIAALTVAVLAAVLTVPPLMAGESEGHAQQAIAAKEAFFASAVLDKDPAQLKDLAKILGQHKGVLAAKYDDQAKLLKVVLDPKLTSAKNVHKALAGSLTDLELKKVGDTKWEAKDCGKCPHAAKCAKEEKDAKSS
jgi:hypothetical protein